MLQIDAAPVENFWLRRWLRPLITQTDTHMMSSVSHYRRRRRRRRAMWCGDVVTKLVGRRTRRKLLWMSQNDSLIGVEDLS